MKGSNKKNKYRNNILRKRYILALSIIAFLVLFTQITIQYTIKKQESDSRVVNIAGRQRMLSQRISKEVLAIYLANDDNSKKFYLDELIFSTNLWAHSHEGLINGDKELGLPGKNSTTVSNLFHNIDSNYNKILEAASSVIAMEQSGDYNKASLSSKISIIKENEPIFLKGMDTIVFQYDSEAREKVAFIKHLELIIMFITFLVLLLEVIYIFRPAEKQINVTLEALNNHATIDEMTGLINRRTGLLILEKEFEKAKRSTSNLTIGFIDLDGLKLVNDNFGHKEGDWFITKVVDVLHEIIRSGDTAFRFGGDEFIIILNDCTLEEGKKVIERIELKLEAINNANNKPYKIGLSCGFAEYSILSPNNIEEFIHYADEKMYENKKTKKQI